MAPPHSHQENAKVHARKIRKRLFVLCDGTWQDGVNNRSRLSNVATLARCLDSIDNDGCLQMVYYDCGVGNATGWITSIIDGATGRGISAKIRNAYSFLSHNYNFDSEQDEIILIGYSRGAFAVQCLASFISQTGLLRKENLYYLGGLFTLWANQEVRGPDVQEPKPGLIKLEASVRKLEDMGLLHPVKITACAVWDTVSRLSLQTQASPHPPSFVGKEVPKQVEHAFQALALDEERPEFKPRVWKSKEDDKTQVSQCWFLGSHGDVGGIGDASLGAFTLLWMIGLLHDRLGVSFVEKEIGKHLKHRFFEWDFTVNKRQGHFDEKKGLSSVSATGSPGRPPWYRWPLGRETRAGHMRSNRMTEVHFTARVLMALGHNSCAALEAWRTKPAGQNKVYWCLNGGEQKLEEHGDGEPRLGEHSPKEPDDDGHNNGEEKPNENGRAEQELSEHELAPTRKEGRSITTGNERYLLKRWFGGAFNNMQTDRTPFLGLESPVTPVQDTEPKELREVAVRLKYINFDHEGQPDATRMYTGRD